MLWAFVISNLNVKGIVGMFNKKEMQMTNPTEFRIEKVVRTKRQQSLCEMEGLC